MWFEELFGFAETTFHKTKQRFHMDGNELVCPTSPHPRQWVGPFETPSLGELRERLAATPPSGAQGGLRFRHLADPVGIVPLIMSEENAGAVFQARTPSATHAPTPRWRFAEMQPRPPC